MLFINFVYLKRKEQIKRRQDLEKRKKGKERSKKIKIKRKKRTLFILKKKDNYGHIQKINNSHSFQKKTFDYWYLLRCRFTNSVKIFIDTPQYIYCNELCFIRILKIFHLVSVYIKNNKQISIKYCMPPAFSENNN